ncbi:monovalent cation/H+ antiporter complex subunit F [Proteinivorax hydrogeniformans]|uniref:Monovalent cation/H+ antiporter complex subunit F n=2 Tax=Proteinivorax TaxID=1491776 RepID=A0AAU7VKW3_9FIRM
MIALIMQGILVFLALLAFVGLYVAYKGPKAAHRVIAINVIFTKVAIIIALLAIVNGQGAFVDVALVYAMMGFVATVSVSKYLEKGRLD